MKKLKYIGPGFVPGVPAQDHNCEDDEQAEALVKGGAYEYATPPKEKDNKPDE